MAESTEKQVQQRPARGWWHSDHLCMVAARMKNQERWIPVSRAWWQQGWRTRRGGYQCHSLYVHAATWGGSRCIFFNYEM